MACWILRFKSLVCRILKSRFSKQTLENYIFQMQSFEMPSFVCGINNSFFFWEGGKPWGGGQECSLEQCCNQFETTWVSCDEECKSELLFVPFNFPFKMRCLWKLALILMVKFLCSLRCRCLNRRWLTSNVTHPVVNSFILVFHFLFWAVEVWSATTGNHKALIYSTSIFADDREHVRHFLQKKPSN